MIDVDEDPAGQRIVGTRHKDMLAGNSGHDTMLGLANNDRIFGNAGDDHITGGLGVDRMSGGSGDDTFVVRTIADFGPGYDGPIGNGIYSPARGAGMRDVRTDLQTGHDKLDVSAIDANVDQSGNQAFRFLGLGDMDVKGSLVFRTFDKAGTASDKPIVYGDIDGNGLADFQLELTGIHKLTASDFVL